MLSTFDSAINPLAFIIGSFAVYIIARYFLASRRPNGFPQGPPTVPFLGNLHQLPRSRFILQFHRWCKDYGDIIGLKFGSKNVVILNDYKHVTESHISSKIIYPDNIHILFVPYSVKWRALRKCAQQLLSITAVEKFIPIQHAEASQTLHDLIHSPEEYYDHIRRYATAVILATVYGQRGATFSTPKVQALYHVQDQFTDLVQPGATPPIDEFPVLKYLPEFMSPWKTRARKIRSEQRALYMALNETKLKIGQDKEIDCFMSRLIKDQGKNGLTNEDIAYVGGSYMEAGSDTTSATLLSFCLAMTKYPEVLKKCQAEVDSVCPDRTPIITDVNNLPYLRAAMNEVLRWRPVVPGGIPHAVTEHDTYGDHVIPKDTVVFANTWAIGHDESEYENPDAFIPERFLNNKYGARYPGDEAGNEGRRITYGFGAGRRTCPGQRLAENSLMINMAKLVWTFDIFSPSPETVDTSVETAFVCRATVAPLKFPAKFVPRSQSHVNIVENEFQEAELFLSKYHLAETITGT